jgi:hypothetical protein
MWDGVHPHRGTGVASYVYSCRLMGCFSATGATGAALREAVSSNLRHVVSLVDSLAPSQGARHPIIPPLLVSTRFHPALATPH